MHRTNQQCRRDQTERTRGHREPDKRQHAVHPQDPHPFAKACKEPEAQPAVTYARHEQHNACPQTQPPRGNGYTDDCRHRQSKRHTRQICHRNLIDPDNALASGQFHTCDVRMHRRSQQHLRSQQHRGCAHSREDGARDRQRERDEVQSVPRLSRAPHAAAGTSGPLHRAPDVRDSCCRLGDSALGVIPLR